MSRTRTRTQSADFESSAKKKFVFMPSKTIFKDADIFYIRNIEKMAAIKIQAWWRGVACRKKTKDMFILCNIKKAEFLAKNAMVEIKKLKGQLSHNSSYVDHDLFVNFNMTDIFKSRKSSKLFH